MHRGRDLAFNQLGSGVWGIGNPVDPLVGVGLHPLQLGAGIVAIGVHAGVILLGLAVIDFGFLVAAIDKAAVLDIARMRIGRLDAFDFGPRAMRVGVIGWAAVRFPLPLRDDRRQGAKELRRGVLCRLVV